MTSKFSAVEWKEGTMRWTNDGYHSVYRAGSGSVQKCTHQQQQSKQHPYTQCIRRRRTYQNFYQTSEKRSERASNMDGWIVSCDFHFKRAHSTCESGWLQQPPGTCLGHLPFIVFGYGVAAVRRLAPHNNRNTSTLITSRV